MILLDKWEEDKPSTPGPLFYEIKRIMEILQQISWYVTMTSASPEVSQVAAAIGVS